jgi:hypothetical protein
MTRHLITIRGLSDREQAARWSMHAKEGMRIEFKQAKRSGEQNDKLWAMLTEVAAQVPWHGIKLAPDDWKFIFLDSLKRELRVVPNIDGTGFVNLGRSSSDLSKSEMSDLIELIHAFGAGHGVVFKDSNSLETEPSPRPGSQVDEPAADVVPPSEAAGALSQSSAASPADDEAQADVTRDAAGLPSDLSADWQDTYLRAMARVTDRPKSLTGRHAEALQLIGGKANADEQAWMKAVYRLTERRLRGEITKDECDAAIREIS